MKIKVLLAAIAAGLLAGILMTPLQYTKVIPIILHAEHYEGDHSHGAAVQDTPTSLKQDHALEDDAVHTADHQPIVAHDDTGKVAHVHADSGKSDAGHNEAGLASASGGDDPLWLGRVWNTVLANLVTGAGYGLLMAAVSLAVGVNVTVASGLVWGALGWLCVQLLPALGLPPELPGFPHIDLAARQYWWVLTVVASIVGFWLALLFQSIQLRILGAAMLIAPHVYGAPLPVDIASAVPGYLASQYAVASLSTMLFFWLVLALALGWFMDRMKLQTS